jgi:HPt (histidine-containing phosphotransfer) domain-containing protein
MKDIEARMRELTEQFITRSITRREALAAARERLVRAAPSEGRDEIMRLAHSLGGVAGLFGFDEIGQLATRLDEECRDTAISDARIDALCGELLTLLDALPHQRR